MICGEGPENAKIILLSDYPTKENFANQRVCYGSEYQYYAKHFRRLKYSVDSIWRTSLFRKELPPSVRRLLTKNKLRYPLGKDNEANWLNVEIENAAEEIFSELDVLKESKFIIIAGEIPLNLFAEEKKITKFQGSILPFANKWRLKYPFIEKKFLIPILPYRTIVSQPLMESIISIFLDKAIQFTKEQYVPFDKKYNIWVCDSAVSFREFINRNRNAEYFTSDYETLHNHPTCISFCGDGRESVSIPLLGSSLPLETKVELWHAVCEFFKYLRRNKIPLINQNFNYDWTIGDKCGMKYGENYGGDTMIYSHVLYPEFPRDLGFLTSIYTDIPYFKDEGKEFDPSKHDFKRLYLYNATDALATHIIYGEQEKDAQDLGVKDFYEKKEAPLLLVYHSIEQNGIRVDGVARTLLQIKYEQMLEERISFVQSFYDEGSINFKSPKQVARFLYDYLALPPRYKYDFDSDTGERSKKLATGEDEIEENAIRELDPTISSILYSIIAIRKLYKILEFLRTPEHLDGKMRCGTKLTGTKSGRTSGAQSLDFSLQWDAKNLRYEKVPMGYSFQTIPKHAEVLPDGTVIGGDLRKIFVPEHDYCFIEGDKSQAEARVVCVLSDDLKLLPLFDDKKIGIHRTTASWIFNCAAHDISKKDDARYDTGKRARHAGNYGMTPPRLAIMAHIKLNMAEFILNKFHKAQPNIQNVFHKSIQSILHSNSPILITPQGRRREFFGRKDESLYKEGYSYYPQAVVSDDLKFGMKRIFDRAKDWVWILNEAHDSILVTTHKTNKNHYIDIWKQEMEQPINFNCGTLKRDVELVIPTELSYSESNWNEMEDLR